MSQPKLSRRALDNGTHFILQIPCLSDVNPNPRPSASRTQLQLTADTRWMFPWICSAGRGHTRVPRRGLVSGFLFTSAVQRFGTAPRMEISMTTPEDEANLNVELGQLAVLRSFAIVQTTDFPRYWRITPPSTSIESNVQYPYLAATFSFNPNHDCPTSR